MTYTHGGKRPGAGAKKKTETDRLTFRLDADKKKKIKAKCDKRLNQMFKDWIDKLLED